jgi:hypothetical protein
MSKQLIVVYHLYQINRWEQLFCEQIGMLAISGLLEKAKVIVSVNGQEPLPLCNGPEIIRHATNNGEKDALLLAYDYALKNENACIMYMHSKGISHPTDNQDDWRMMMQYFMINNWKMAVDYLSDHDIVTVNWRTYPCPHPSGNYWWTNADFLRKLNPAFLSDTDRTTHEFWLGTSPSKVANLYETELDHYNHSCPPSSYSNGYFVEKARESHVLSFGSRKDAILAGIIKPVFKVDWF